MKILKSAILAVVLSTFASACALYAETSESVPNNAPASHWQSKKVAFLGDSITDKIHVGTEKNYWQYLKESIGIVPYVYAVNGNTYKDILTQAKKLKNDLGEDIDAIIIFAGTNDYNGSIPIGEWYEYMDAQAEIPGGTELRKRRKASMDSSTFKGRINIALAYIKEEFPDQQIILLTPIHRGYAKFSATNVQTDESFPNRIGLYIDSYVNAVKEASNVWAVSVIDLNSLCGLFPNTPSHSKFFANKKTDLLHPNASGHKRIAEVLRRVLENMPSDFK